MIAYKFLSKTSYVVEAINQNQIYCSAPHEFNDALEGIKLSAASYQGTEESWRNLAGSLRISCFTKNLDNPLMWAYYGNGFSNAAIEVELDEKALTGAAGEQARLIHVRYSQDAHVEPLPPTSLDAAYESYACKFPFWAHEDEVRVIAPEVRLLNDRFFTDFDLKQVLIGARMRPEDQQEIKKACLARGIPCQAVWPKIDGTGITKQSDFYSATA